MPWATVFDNVSLPLELKGIGAGKAARPRRARRSTASALPTFAAPIRANCPAACSMRVSIARALVTEPQLLLMDEPFAALDEITRFKLNDDLLRMWQALRTTVVFVTHSVFEIGLFVEPHRGHGGAAGPGLRRACRRRALSARPRVSAPRPNTPRSAAARRKR